MVLPRASHQSRIMPQLRAASDQVKIRTPLLSCLPPVLNWSSSRRFRSWGSEHGARRRCRSVQMVPHSVWRGFTQDGGGNPARWREGG